MNFAQHRKHPAIGGVSPTDRAAASCGNSIVSLGTRTTRKLCDISPPRSAAAPTPNANLCDCSTCHITNSHRCTYHMCQPTSHPSFHRPWLQIPHYHHPIPRKVKLRSSRSHRIPRPAQVIEGFFSGKGRGIGRGCARVLCQLPERTFAE